MTDEKEKQDPKELALELALATINKQFGKGSILSGDETLPGIETISTGCISLDKALGCGGLPRGRIIELIGPESSGKTTLCLHVAAETQKQNGKVAIIDAEHALDFEYATNLGVDASQLLISQPSSGEQALETVDILARTGAIDVVIIDSVAALVPQKELDGDMEILISVYRLG